MKIKKNKIVVTIVFIMLALLSIIGIINRIIQGDNFNEFYINFIVIFISLLAIIFINFVKFKIAFPKDIIKYGSCIVFYLVASFFIIKDVVIKDILLSSINSETWLALFLVLFFGFGGFFILPRYLKTSVKQQKVLVSRKGHHELLKSLLNDIPQVTYLYAMSNGFTIGSKSPYIEDDETFVLTDSKHLLTKQIFNLSFKNKLNIYYPMHIDNKDLMNFFEACFCYGFQKFSYTTGNGTVELHLKDIINIQMDFIRQSELNFLHNYFIFEQKNSRKLELAKAGIDNSEETEKVNYYLNKSILAFDNALFFALCSFYKNEENTLYISEKANAIISKDDFAELNKITNNMSTTIITMSNDVRLLGFLFSKIDNAEKFKENNKKISFDEDLEKSEALYKSRENYSRDEQAHIIQQYSYYRNFEDIKKKIEASSFCIITGEELKTIQNQFLFDSDGINNTAKVNIISVPGNHQNC